tara:strand:- start:1217 stop:2143 length:927 start_codon:yes stop_codon:yes gene_type:complete
MARTAADWTVYRVFFKGSPTPVDIQTRASWAIAKHRGIRLGSSFSDDFDNIGKFQNTMHLTGPKRPWHPSNRPANKEFSGSLDDPAYSASETEASLWPVESIAGMFHRNIFHGTQSTLDGIPETVDGNAYRIYFKNCPATMDVLAGGFVVTSQESIRMVKPGAESVLHRIDRGGGFMVYFYAYGGQFYADEHDWTTGSTVKYLTYPLRFGLAGAMGSGSGTEHPVSGERLGTTASLDSAATFLPLDNVRAIIRLNGSDNSEASDGGGYYFNSPEDYQVRVVQPTRNASTGLWTIFQPTAVGAALKLSP